MNPVNNPELDALDCQIRQAIREDDQYRYGFLHGRAVELTKGMDEHPKNWNHPCQCDTCNSYAD